MSKLVNYHTNPEQKMLRKKKEYTCHEGTEIPSPTFDLSYLNLQIKMIEIS